MAEATTALRIRDLFDLPERVVKNDFVIRLHDGIKDEEGTLKIGLLVRLDGGRGEAEREEEGQGEEGAAHGRAPGP